MKRAIAGPWVGEFGWELMSWQAYLRKRSTEFDEFVVCAPPASAALYSDFAHRFVPVTVKTGVADCWRREAADLGELRLLEIAAHKLNGTLIEPYGLIPKENQSFIRFGKQNQPGYDIVVHARHPIGKRPYHSYSQEKWNRLVTKLLGENLSVAAIGTQAFLPSGAHDRRGLELQDTMNLIASSRMVAGPASGPILLSMLCSTPTLSWTDRIVYSVVKGTNKQRIETIWNPLHTESIVADDLGWDPEPEALFHSFMEALKRWPRRA